MLNAVSAAHRIFWPYVVTALFSSLLIGSWCQGDIYSAEGDETLRVVFGIALFVCAFARAKHSARLPEAWSLALCLLPFASALLMGVFVRPEYTGDYRGWEVAAMTKLCATGARFSLALLAAELVTWIRFTGPKRDSALLGVLLALPYQASWLTRAVVIARGERFGLPVESVSILELTTPVAELLFGLFALVVIPLALVRGARVVSVLVGMAAASVMVFVIKCGVFATLTFAPRGTSPLSRFELSEILSALFFGVDAAEHLFWLPGVVSLSLGMLLLRTRPPVVLLGITVLLTAAQLAATARLGEFADQRDGEIAGFVPRGQGLPADVLRVSADGVFDGSTFTRVAIDKLGNVLAGRAKLEPWHPCSRRFVSLQLTLDARLTNEQEMKIAAVARDAGIEALEVFEGEARGEPGSPLFLSTHVRRIVSGSNVGTFWLTEEKQGCQLATVRSTLRLDGLRWQHGEFRLDLPQRPHTP